jgi:hypothetical protein
LGHLSQGTKELPQRAAVEKNMSPAYLHAKNVRPEVIFFNKMAGHLLAAAVSCLSGNTISSGG